MLIDMEQKENYSMQAEFPFALLESFVIFQRYAIRQTGDWKNCVVKTITAQLSVPQEMVDEYGIAMPVNPKIIIPQAYDTIQSTVESMEAKGYCVITPEPMEKPMLTPAFIPMKVREPKPEKTEWVNVDV